MQYEVMETDILIVGAGPAGLSAAIRLGQLSVQQNKSLSIMVLEKGASVGAHTLSGAVLEPRALDELLPDWKEKGAPLHTPVSDEAMWWLTAQRKFRLPTPPLMHNAGNYIISLGRFTEWLGLQAESLGAQIMPGFAAAEAWIENGALQGVVTGAFGVDKAGEKTTNYQPPVAIKAKYTLFAEGCRGSLSEQLMRQFDLRRNCQHQTYGLGIKELWQLPEGRTQQGRVEHTIGWPLDNQTYGGAFVYHLSDQLLALGLVVGLDYQNPHLDPFREMQRFKTHPYLSGMLSGGKRIGYGARALNEGGLQSLPALAFQGGALIGCAAGFLNVPKIKGTHTAMKSGMLAAEAAFDAITHGRQNDSLDAYPTRLQSSWVMQELHAARNIRPAFRFGRLGGMVYSGFDMLLAGHVPWTLKHGTPDHLAIKPAAACTPIAYAPPDNVLTFDRMRSVFLSGTNHSENQPCHLKLTAPEKAIALNLAIYDAPEQRYCPAGVYEIILHSSSKAVVHNNTPHSSSDLSAEASAQAEVIAQKSRSSSEAVAQKYHLQINAQNCIHCKTCDIKDPTLNITWTPPEGSGGPHYQGM